MTSTSIETSLSTAAKAEVSRQLDTAQPFVPFLAKGIAFIRALTAPPPLPVLATGLQPLAPRCGNPQVCGARDYVLAPRRLAKPKPKTMLAVPPLASAKPSVLSAPSSAPAAPDAAALTGFNAVASAAATAIAVAPTGGAIAAPSATTTASPKAARGSIPAAVSNTKADIIYLGIDAHAEFQVVVLQVDATVPKPAQKFSVENLLIFASKQLSLAHRVVACYEAGPCGYSLSRKLIAMGIDCRVVRPRCLDTFGAKVKTDARDARALCEALERYCKGNTNALSVIRLPTEAEEQQRSITRQRDALVDTRKRTAAQGRSAVLFAQHCLRMKGQWWKPRAWARWQAQLSDTLLALLAPWHAVLISIDAQIEALTECIEARAKTSAARHILPKGIGELTQEVIANEVCDWNRFNNRCQVSSFTGLCPRESSSGGNRRQGGVNKHGNPMLRKSLCEAVWRLLKYQPEWIRFERMKEKFKAASGGRKKQLVTALARMLAIDLWRLNTGRTTLEALGFIAAADVVTRVKRTPKAAGTTSSTKGKAASAKEASAKEASAKAAPITPVSA